VGLQCGCAEAPPRGLRRIQSGVALSLPPHSKASRHSRAASSVWMICEMVLLFVLLLLMLSARLKRSKTISRQRGKNGPALVFQQSVRTRNKGLILLLVLGSLPLSLFRLRLRAGGGFAWNIAITLVCAGLLGIRLSIALFRMILWLRSLGGRRLCLRISAPGSALPLSWLVPPPFPFPSPWSAAHAGFSMFA